MHFPCKKDIYHFVVTLYKYLAHLKAYNASIMLDNFFKKPIKGKNNTSECNFSPYNDEQRINECTMECFKIKKMFHPNISVV